MTLLFSDNKMMGNKYFLTGWLLLLLSHSLFSQSRRTVRELGIKTVSAEQTEYKNGAVESGRNTFMSYDKKGNLLLEIEYNSDSTFRKKELNEYNCKNNLIKNIVFGTNGNVKVTTLIKYNNFGDKIEEIQMDDAERVIEKTVYSYNGFGLKIKETVYDSNQKPKKITEYSYDSRGALTERKTYNDLNELISRKKYIYNY